MPFNAALLATVLDAYPDTRVTFFGESEHMGLVQKHLEAHHIAFTDRVSWEGIEVPVRGGSGFSILKRERLLCRHLLREARASDVEAVVLCSVTNTGLLFLKPLLLLARFRKPVVAVLHGILGSLQHPASRKPWYWALHLRRVLWLPHPPTLRYIALSASILEHLNECCPRFVEPFRVLDHPYLWIAEAPPQSPPPVRFGFFGTTSDVKRFDRFCRLAHEVSREVPEAEFVLAGFATGDGCSAEHHDVVRGMGTQPLAPEEFAKRAASLTYSVWAGDPEHYRLVASASFLDSLYYGKPGIYLRNPYVEHYFDEMGDLGYLVDSYEEMRELLIQLARDFPQERYRRQCATIVQARKALSPEALSGAFRAIVEQVGA